jgi:hypothetical protein
MQKTN